MSDASLNQLILDNLRDKVKLTLPECDEVHGVLEDISVDQTLRGLIVEVGLLDVICCLDLIMKDDHDLRLIAHHVNPQYYPVV